MNKKWFKEGDKIPEGATLIKEREITYDDKNGIERQVTMKLYQLPEGDNNGTHDKKNG